MIGFLRRWNRRKCWDCGCQETRTVIKETINGTVAEFVVLCCECGEEVNYWAHGSYQYPITKTATVKCILTWSLSLPEKLRLIARVVG